MSGLLELPLEVVLEIIKCLSKKDIISLSKCNKACREGIQAFVMPRLEIKVDGSVKKQGNKVELEQPVIHNSNIKVVCSSARDGLLDYFLGSVTELVIDEQYAVRHRFREPEELADYSPTNSRTSTMIKAFDYFSPQYLVTRLTALNKIIVHGNIQCLCSPLPKLNDGVFWQCLAARSPRVNCKVYLTRLYDNKWKSIKMGNTVAFNYLAGICEDLIRMKPVYLDQFDNRLVESFTSSYQVAWDENTRVLQNRQRFDLQVLQRFANLRSITIFVNELREDLEQIAPSLEKLTVRSKSISNNASAPDAPLAFHYTLKELVCRTSACDRRISREIWTELLMFRFPNLSNFVFNSDCSIVRWRDIEPLLIQTLGQSTNLEAFSVDSCLYTSCTKSATDWILQGNYAFSKSVRVLTLEGDATEDGLISNLPFSSFSSELRVLQLLSNRRVHCHHLFADCTLGTFRRLLKQFPKLELMIYPEVVTPLWIEKELANDVESLKASAKALFASNSPTNFDTRCHQFFLQWAVWKYGRANLALQGVYTLN